MIPTYILSAILGLAALQARALFQSNNPPAALSDTQGKSNVKVSQGVKYTVRDGNEKEDFILASKTFGHISLAHASPEFVKNIPGELVGEVSLQIELQPDLTLDEKTTAEYCKALSKTTQISKLFLIARPNTYTNLHLDGLVMLLMTFDTCVNENTEVLLATPIRFILQNYEFLQKNSNTKSIAVLSDPYETTYSVTPIGSVLYDLVSVAQFFPQYRFIILNVYWPHDGLKYYKHSPDGSVQTNMLSDLRAITDINTLQISFIFSQLFDTHEIGVPSYMNFNGLYNKDSNPYMY